MQDAHNQVYSKEQSIGNPHDVGVNRFLATESAESKFGTKNQQEDISNMDWRQNELQGELACILSFNEPDQGVEGAED